MKCKYCDSLLEENAKFCIECGKPVENIEANNNDIELPEVKKVEVNNSLDELPETKSDIIPKTSEEVIDKSIEEAKEQNNKTDKRFNFTLVVLVICFVAVGCIALYMLQDFKKGSNNNDNTTTTTQQVADNNCENNNNDVICHISKEHKETIETTVNGVPVKIVFRENVFEIYVNNKYVIEDSDVLLSNKVTFKSIGNYIVYTTIGGTDIRSNNMIFIGKDGTIVKDLSDPEVTDSGMYADPETIAIENNKIVVPATRISHGTSIITDNTGAEEKYICSNELNLPDDYIVNATYTFVINDDGTIDFNNYEREITKTLAEFKQETADNCVNNQEE